MVEIQELHHSSSEKLQETNKFANCLIINKEIAPKNFYIVIHDNLHSLSVG